MLPANIIPKCFEYSPGSPIDSVTLHSIQQIQFCFSCCRYKPFSSEPVPSLLSTHKIRGTLTKIVQADFKFPDDIELSNACQDLVVKCLTSDPKERINPHEIWRHPWICMSRYPP